MKNRGLMNFSSKYIYDVLLANPIKFHDITFDINNKCGNDINAKDWPFITIYYDFTSMGKIPTKLEYYFAYKNAYEEDIIKKIGKEKSEQLLNRAARNYSSLIMEHHFYSLLREVNDQDINSLTNEELDIGGIDIMIIYKDIKFGISLGCVGKNSKNDYIKKKKWRRGKRITCGEIIDFYLVDEEIDWIIGDKYQLNRASHWDHKVNCYLYDSDDAFDLIDIIKNIVDYNRNIIDVPLFFGFYGQCSQINRRIINRRDRDV